MKPYSIEKLSYLHTSIIQNFICGNGVLDDYLKQKALDDPDSVTYVVVNDKQCMAYFSLSCGAIYIKSSNQFYSYPAVEIKNLAVHVDFQNYYPSDAKHSFSKLLLDTIICEIIADFTENICGANRVILYSVPDAVDFYKRSGFIDFHQSFITDDSYYLSECIPLIYNY